METSPQRRGHGDTGGLPTPVRRRMALRRLQNRSLRGALAFVAASLLAGAVTLAFAPHVGRHLWWVPLSVAVVLGFEFFALSPNERTTSTRPARRVFVAASLTTLVILALELVDPSGARAALAVVVSASLACLAAVGLRRLVSSPRRVVVVGDLDSVQEFVAHWGARRDIAIVGSCLAGAGRADEPLPATVGIDAVPVLGRAQGVGEMARGVSADEVVIVPGPHLSTYDVRRLGWTIDPSQIEITVATDVHGTHPRRISPRVEGENLFLTVRPAGSPPVKIAKEIADRVGAAVLLLVLSPLMLAVAVTIKVTSPGPVLFRQVRTGRGGEEFSMIKFRSMVVDAEERLAELQEQNEADGPLFKLARDPRVTRVGQFIRATSIDELPQLWNVLRGDMSLIGPRPGLPCETATYDDWVRHRLVVKPGMTGLWQVSGRSDLDWDSTVGLDLHYADNWSFSTDLAILARTVRAVFKREGAR